MTTKDPLPMDIEFITQDTFALTRPQWKIITDFELAGHAFAESVAQNYKGLEFEKNVEAEPMEEEISSDDDGDDDDLQVPEMEEAHSSSDEAETEVRKNQYYIVNR